MILNGPQAFISQLFMIDPNLDRIKDEMTKDMPQENILKKVGFASAIMMASVFLSRVMGVFREMTIAGVGGIHAQVDAYQVAFVIPEILNHIVASGFLSITFIPILSRYLVKNQEEKGFKAFSLIMNTFGLVLLFFIGLSMFFAPRIVGLFAPGMTDPATFSLAVKMTRIIIPAQFFFFTGGLLMAVQFAKEHFFIPALAPLIYNLFIILGGLLLGPYIGMEGFAWGVLAGAFAGNFVIQIFGAARRGARYYPILSFTHPDLVTYVKLTLPLMLGLTMTFSMEILLKYFGSFLEPGAIAAMNYAIRIMFILVGLFGQAVGVASYPYMAKLARNKDLTELNALLNQTLRFIFLVIPVSVLFMVLSREIVHILFQRGQFDAAATAVTAGILPFFMAGAFAFSAQNIVSRGYYAIQNTLFPVIFTTICVLASLPVIGLFMKMMGAKGVALGLSVTVAIQCFVLFECWNKQSANKEKKRVYLFFIKILPLSLVLGIILKICADYLRGFFDPASVTHSLILCFLISAEFCILFLFSGLFLGIEEIMTLKSKVFRRLAR